MFIVSVVGGFVFVSTFESYKNEQKQSSYKSFQMKRLLLPLLAALALPTAVNANWFTGDIVETNTVGEKTIVKKSTVKISDTYTVRDYEKGINGAPTFHKERGDSWGITLKKYEDKYEDCLSKEKESWCNSKMVVNTVKTYPEVISEYKTKIRKDEKLRKEAENRLKELTPVFEKINKKQIIFISMSYTPIFENINGKKFVESTRYIKCENKLVNFKSLYSACPACVPYLYKNSLDKRICKKYAKF